MTTFTHPIRVSLENCGLLVSGPWSLVSQPTRVNADRFGCGCAALRNLWLIALAWVTSSFAQSPADFEWVTHFQGSGANDKARWVTVDREGNSYPTGEFSGTLTVGNKSITSRGKLDMFVAKLDARGGCIWLQHAGGKEDDRGYRAATDEAGNCYVSGSYESKDFSVGGHAVALSGSRGAFLAKFSSDGKALWVRSAEGATDAYGFGVAVDRNGNCYWTGAAAGQTTFGSFSINGKSAIYYLAKYDGDGVARWVQSAGGNGANGGRGIAIDVNGNALVTGFITGLADFGGHRVGAENVRNIFAASYDSTGKIIWVNDGGGKSDGIGQAIGSDAQGNVYSTGMFKGSPVYDNQPLRSAGADDVFLIKYDSNGKVVWSRSAGGAGVDYALALAVRPNGLVLITGDFFQEPMFEGVKLENKGRNDAFVAQYRANGQLDWVRTIGGPANDVCYALAVAPDGSVVVAPSFNERTAFGNRTLTSLAGADVLVGKLKTIR